MLTVEWLILALTCLLSATGAVLLSRRRSSQFLLPLPEVPGDVLPEEQPLVPNPGRADVDMFSRAPVAIWTTDSQGRLAWCNDAYKSLCRWRDRNHMMGDDPVFHVGKATEPNDGPDRVALYARTSSEPEWYEITRTQHKGTCICYAQNVTALVGIEESKRTFFQTMAGTFAQLSIGLAIFDEQRRLNLFNPALVDLCGLPFAFLSSRPDLATFFDRLRETQSMPEPRDYAAWRSEMSDLARAAEEGRYQETWTLPSGSVYQVTGRPHPGGAIAFLFEDISAEVSLARQFRTELALFASVLDCDDEAVCVFTASEKAAFANIAFRKMWGIAPDHEVRGTPLADFCAEWSRVSCRELNAETIHHIAAAPSEGLLWEDLGPLPDGGRARLTSVRLPGGGLLIRMTSAAEIEPREQKGLATV